MNIRVEAEARADAQASLGFATPELGRPEKLHFVGRDPWYRESACGRYRVTKVLIRGEPRYEAIAFSEGHWIWLGTMFEAFSLAVAICQKDRDSRGVAV